ncbi:hypothetical protein LO762_25770 [Actinocorallia sp. API 0066]|nr:hypothetical protein [Actinocorallia sp. API 0066]MCD0452565.1 hypothetical protein [Actinocorallia sp. API 0066]
MLKLLKIAGRGLVSVLAGAVGLAIGYGLWIGYWRRCAGIWGWALRGLWA